MLLGLVVLTLTAISVAMIQRKIDVPFLAVKLSTPLWAAGFGGIIVGAFRLVLASEPEQTSSGKRMALGVLFGCGTLVLLAVLGLLLLLVVEWITKHSS